MDCKISKKERRVQKGETIDVYVDGIFDKYPILAEDGVTVLDVETVDNMVEIQQAALFASLKQKGRDPLSPDVGVRWEETLVDEVPPEVLMTDIREAVSGVSTAAQVIFGTVTDREGNSYLTYDIKVAL